MKKQLFSLLMVAICGSVYAWEGSGTKSDPYLIQRPEDLRTLSANSGLDNYSGMYFKLDRNIFFVTGYDELTPITGFCGTFDGGGFTIDGFKILLDTEDNVGLFKTLGSSAIVKDLTLGSNCYVTGNNNVGGFAGENNGGTITNCVNTANVSGAGNVGGFVGKNTKGIIINSTNNGVVTGSADYVGGVVGCYPDYRYSDEGSNIDGCINSGSITGNGNYVGGIAGCRGDSKSWIPLFGSNKNTGDVTGNEYTGGIIGEGHCDGCENSGKVTGTSDVGGIVGSSSPNWGYDLNDNVNTGEVTGGAVVGGICGWGSPLNCINRGKVTGGKGVGGIAGSGYRNVKNCENYGAVKSTDTGGDTYIGGIVGSCSTRGMHDGLVEGCTNYGTVEGYRRVGGIAGECNVKNCNNYGQITGLMDVGGIVAVLGGEGYSASNCVNSGNIIGTGVSVNGNPSREMGGIVGYAWPGSTIVDCVNKANVTGNCFIGGIVGTGGSNNGYITLTGNIVEQGTITGGGAIAGVLHDISSENCSRNYYLQDVVVVNDGQTYEGMTPRGVAGICMEGSSISWGLTDIAEGRGAVLRFNDTSKKITFSDPAVKAICVANWDVNEDGELTEKEAAVVTSIGTKFYNKNSITSFDELHYFTGLTKIEKQAFAGCRNLASITFPNTLKEIGNYAFSQCNALTSISIPCDVTSITLCAFYGCVGLTDVYCYAESVPDTDETAFQSSNITNATLHVPVGSVEAYKAKLPWSGFKEIVADVKVSLNKTTATIEKSKTLTLKATVSPSILFDKSVTWKSSKTSVATVTSSGKVTGVKAGTATITCTSVATGAKATCKVTVGYVKLDKTEAIVEKTKTLTLKAIVYPSSLEDKSVTWKSSKMSVATVTSSGKVKGVKAGTATITCTSNATGLSTTCKVTVGYVTLDKTEAIVEKTKTLTLTPTVYPSSLEDKSVTWKSSNTKVATVTSSGKVKGVKAGTATITCTSNATGLSTTCKVTVGYVKLNKSEAVIEKTKTLTLKATVYPSSLEDRSVTWKSSNTAVATVTSSGKVKGVKAGKATITCTSNATGLKVTCKVTVGYVKLDQTEVTVKKGKTITLTPTVYPSSLTDKSVTWTSSDKSVATVTKAGKVKGIAAGMATITCTSVATGLSTTCKVTVKGSSGPRSSEGDDDDVTDIETIEEASAPALAEPYDVYDLSGRKVRHQVTSLDGLPDGVYIVNGKKILKK